MKISVCKIFEFHAAHHLPHYSGKCREVHGHSYTLEIEISGEVGAWTGMICDFSELKKKVEGAIIFHLDHKDLNILMENPTAEKTVELIVSRKNQYVPDGAELERVRLYETRTSFAEWRREQQ